MAHYKYLLNYLSQDMFRYLQRFCVILIFLVMPHGAYAEDDSVVLIAGGDSNITNVSILDVRRIYLGISPEDTTQVNKPILNVSDRALYDDFIKNIMHMTEEGYRRKIVKRVFLRGNYYIHEISSNEELVVYLNNNKSDISFIRKKDIKEAYNLKIVAVLW